MPSLTLPSGHKWAYVDANPGAATALLCLHGFPDLGYGYRHQIGPWARAGFRVVVPDMLGYGASDAPIDPAQYTTKRLANDLVALLTALGIDRAVVVGHDWGSFLAGRVALWHPDRVLALVVMSVPYTPPARAPVSLEDVARLAPNLAYQLFIASPEAAPTIEANLAHFLALMYSPPSAPVNITPSGALRAALLSPAPARPLPTVLTGPAFAAYLAAFRARGMTGPTNYYRTTRLRYTEESAVSPPLALPPTLPVLSIYGTRDPSIAPAALKTQRRFAPNLTEVPLEGVGHWVMVEGTRPEDAGGLSTDAWAGGGDGEWWKTGTGDGGAVGRAVLAWLVGLEVAGVRVKL
ncbi:Alpha/Beta hydrolase protein [Mycena rosella]|uniref:Alpha/Beta hydrolase protein n=1 Tax=Mycena rosella TaxID=1033263 RepID=A0AAD7DKK5_MYCRO|nr:Alpha/Beta hydrolase protein [Mycena rosella]